MATKYESPIAHLVKNYDHQNKPHWEGNLTFQQFQQAY